MIPDFAFEPWPYKSLADLLEVLRTEFPDGPVYIVTLDNYADIVIPDGTAVVMVTGDETLRRARKKYLPKWWDALRPGGYHVYHDVLCTDYPCANWTIQQDAGHRKLFTGHFLPEGTKVWLIREHDGEPATFYFRKEA